jgi:hypothetical protein
MRKLLVPFLLLASCAFAAPADAAPTITVRGSRAGYVDVTFAAPFGVDTSDWADVRKGRIGGFYAERIGQPAGEERDAFGVIRISQDGDVATIRMAKPAENNAEAAVYAAGRYRIHVVADGPFTLGLPLTGAVKSVVASPRVFVAKPRLVVQKGLGVGGTVWEAKEKVTIGAVRSAAVSTSFVQWGTAGAHYELVCFAKPGGACDTDKTRTIGGQAGTGAQQRGTGSFFAHPGTLATGTWEAQQRTVTAPGVTFSGMVGMALVFDTPAG